MNDPTAFRCVAARFATGVTVVTTRVGGAPIGMTVNAFATVSLDPLLLVVCLNQRSRTAAAVRHTGVFAVSVLAADQESCARHFATSGRPIGIDGFAGIECHLDQATGCLLLSEAVAYFGCRVYQQQAAGDHCVLLGEVRSFGLLRPVPPLVFADGCYTALTAASPVG